MMNRLSQHNLLHISKDIQLPRYDRSAIKPGIIHLGIGAFHRAHQAFYTEAVLNQLGGDWGIIGCSLRSPAVRDLLEPQDGLYTLVERSGEGERLHIIGAVQRVMVGPEDPAALINVMAAETIKIVSLTITEKGYCHDPTSGNLNKQHPDILHDIANPETPVSAVGFIVAALNKRFLLHQKAFTALSCDNLPNNGDILKSVVIGFAQIISADLARWIQANACFPNTMIDRIVPATTDQDRRDIEVRLGLRDEGMVVCEPFSQWVIEDCFSDGRPAWEKAGALLVKDVKIFEKIKLRLLNGAHSTMAYTGYLSGYPYISDVMAQPAFVNMIRTYMEREASVTIIVPEGFDMEAYRQQLLNRFSNAALKHRTWQIAMDGSQKLPQRLLGSLRDQLKTFRHIDIICLAVAAWIRYVSGTDEKGEAIEVVDPLAKKLRAICDAHAGNPEALNPDAMVRAIVGVAQIFGDDLIHEERFIATTTEWLVRFYRQGVKKTIEDAFE